MTITAIGQFIRRARDAHTPRAEYLDATLPHPAVQMIRDALDHASSDAVIRAIAAEWVRKFGGERASRMSDALVAAVQDARRRGV